VTVSSRRCKATDRAQTEWPCRSAGGPTLQVKRRCRERQSRRGGLVTRRCAMAKPLIRSTDSPHHSRPPWFHSLRAKSLRGHLP
jgi:hypothetical protein